MLDAAGEAASCPCGGAAPVDSDSASLLEAALGSADAAAAAAAVSDAVHLGDEPAPAIVVDAVPAAHPVCALEWPSPLLPSTGAFFKFPFTAMLF